MRCPDKIYVLVSKKEEGRPELSDFYYNRKAAIREVKVRNAFDFRMGGPCDWRVEVYTKELKTKGFQEENPGTAAVANKYLKPRELWNLE